MIISRTPLRISFFGGGTDYPAWYNEHGGAVISTTINKYNYVIARYLPPFFDYSYRVRYSVTEETESIDAIKHPSVRECLKYCKDRKGMEIQHNGDLPALSGLGSSSSFTVGLLNAILGLKGQMLSKRQLALMAIDIEQNCIGEPVGSQDQTAAAFGGLNHIQFGGDPEIVVSPMTLGLRKLKYLQNHLMLFFTGFPRYSATITQELVDDIQAKADRLRALDAITQEAISTFNGDVKQYDEIGRLLDHTWEIKRSLTDKISSPHIDDIYSTGKKAGALGGKILGAGGGGFMLFYIDPEYRTNLKTALKDLLHVPFRFENVGSQIIYYVPTNGSEF